MVDPDTLDPVPSPGSNDDDGSPLADAPVPPVNPDPMTNEHSFIAPYQESTFDTEYTYDTGLLMLPVGREGAPNILAQRATKAGGKIVTWKVTRWFEKPKIPSRHTGDSNEVYIRGIVYPANPLQTRNGLLWVISGRYEYSFYVPKDVGQPGVKFPVGVPTAEVASPTERFFDTTVDIDPKPLDASGLQDGFGVSINLNQVIQQEP